jgi:hypothetical protein
VTWDGYTKALGEASEEWKNTALSSWEQLQTELNAIFANPKIEPNFGRVTTARAVARLYSRMDRVGMILAAAEQTAFDQHIRPLRPQSEAPKPKE